MRRRSCVGDNYGNFKREKVKTGHKREIEMCKKGQEEKYEKEEKEEGKL